MQGSAKRLVKTALQEAAKKREMRYSDLKKIDRGVRRHFHDDITVIVVFLDSNLVSKATVKCSVRGGGISLPPNTLAPYTTTPTEAGNTWSLNKLYLDVCLYHCLVWILGRASKPDCKERAFDSLMYNTVTLTWNLILALSFFLCPETKKNWRRRLQGHSQSTFPWRCSFPLLILLFILSWNFRSVNCMTWQIKLLHSFTWLSVSFNSIVFHI